mgnify:CR=1 FL=1
MTDENKNVVEVKTECFCQSVWFKEFLVKALAVFVGVYAALSLFAALHKPPMPPCPYGKMMMRPPIQKMHHMKKFDKPQKFDREARKAQFYKNLEEAGFVRKVEAK